MEPQRVELILQCLEEAQSQLTTPISDQLDTPISLKDIEVVIKEFPLLLSSPMCAYFNNFYHREL